MCNWKDPLACPGDLIGGAASNAGKSAMEGVADFFKDAADWAVKNLTTLWLNAPSPDVQGSASPTTWLQDRLSYFVLVAMVAAFLVAAYKLATNPQVQHARDLGDSIVRVLLVTTVGGMLIGLGVEIGEIFSKWILDQADVNLSKALVLGGIKNAGLLLILALIVMLAQLIQVVLMIVRNAMIVYLAAVLPLAAASSSTQAGKQWWSKSVAWLVAFVLYKPVAALIYAGAFKMLDARQNLMTQITGVVAVVMAILALPAIMRFIVPATAQMAAGNAGAMALGVTGAAVATGAMVLSGGAAAAGSAGLSGSMSGAGGAGATGAGATGSAGPGGGSGQGSKPAGPPGSGSSDGGRAPLSGETGDGSTTQQGTGGGAGPSGSTPSPSGGGLVGAAQTGSNVGRGVADGASSSIEEDS